MKIDDLTGIILAGGKSRRFGEDKAGYVVDGRPMAEHVYRALSAITDHVLLSVADLHIRATLPIPSLADHYPGMGPLAGLHAGLRAAKTPWVLVVACDMPYVTPGVLRRLADGRRPGAMAVVARTPDGRTQPLCACYHTALLPLVEEQLSAGGLSMTGLLDVISRVEIVDVPGAPLRNVNTPSDLVG